MQPNELSAIMQFNAAANRIVLDAAEVLSADDFMSQVSPSHGSVKQLLIHQVGGEAYFLAVCQDRLAETDMGQIDALDSLAAIRARFEQAAADMTAYLDGLSAADLDREIVLSLGEHSFRLSVWQVIMQMFSHSHMHRGELSIVMSRLGHPLPTIDMMGYFVKASGQIWPFG